MDYMSMEFDMELQIDSIMAELEFGRRSMPFNHEVDTSVRMVPRQKRKEGESMKSPKGGSKSPKAKSPKESKSSKSEKEKGGKSPKHTKTLKRRLRLPRQKIEV